MTDPCTYVIFGATGNLAKVKLMPALYHLEVVGRLPEGTVILAAGRREWDRGRWQQEVRGMIETGARGGLDEDVFARFCSRLHYFRGDLTDPSTYRALHSSPRSV